ncbi:MAG: hypothetical protein LH630_10620 [Actinomycetia bacterium]|nr:hypothetical protein [Actinomycetes bacterium]
MSTTLSCGQCGAPMRAEQDWCSLCYATVEATFDPLTAPLDEVEGYAEIPAPISPAPISPAPISPALKPLPPTVAEPAVPAEEPTIAVSELDVMFSMLAAEHRQSDPTARIAERLEDRSTRIAVMVGGTVLIGAVLFLILTVLGGLV